MNNINQNQISLFERIENTRIDSSKMQDKIKQLDKVLDNISKMKHLKLQDGSIKLEEKIFKTFSLNIKLISNQIGKLFQEYEVIFDELNNKAEEIQIKMDTIQQNHSVSINQLKLEQQKQIEGIQKEMQLKEEDHLMNVKQLKEFYDKAKRGWTNSVDQFENRVQTQKQNLIKTTKNYEGFQKELKKNFLSTFEDMDSFIKQAKQKTNIRSFQQQKLLNKESPLCQKCSNKQNCENKENICPSCLPKANKKLHHRNLELNNQSSINMSMTMPPNNLFGKLSPIHANNNPFYSSNILKERDLNIPQNKEQNIFNKFHFQKSQKDAEGIDDSQNNQNSYNSSVSFDHQIFNEIAGGGQYKSQLSTSKNEDKYESQLEDDEEKATRELQNFLKKAILFISKNINILQDIVQPQSEERVGYIEILIEQIYQKVKDEINKEKELENQRIQNISKEFILDAQTKEKTIARILQFRRRDEQDMDMSFASKRLSPRSDQSEVEPQFEHHVQQEDILAVRTIEEQLDEIFPSSLNNDNNFTYNNMQQSIRDLIQRNNELLLATNQLHQENLNNVQQPSDENEKIINAALQNKIPLN
ncbi:hypothetical protein ABPG74_012319 [Tetrahymena malaccensis]